jgi:hypothetical protein
MTLSLAACSSVTTSSGGDGGSASGPQQACLDTAKAVATAAQRCGQDYTANYNAFISSVAQGDCANIVQVRDETSLRGTCIPSFSTISCADLTATPAKLDPTCSAQLLHK